ncbi:MAG: nucleotide sugar dehydrogenase [Actinomycetota bacterium]
MTVEALLSRLENSQSKAAVLGLGYVGLPLVISLARTGVPVIGFDVKPDVASRLGRGVSHIDDVSDADLAEVSALTRFTADIQDIEVADVIFICVPTPLAVGKQPDVSYIERAAHLIATVMRPGQLVILESTTYPGTTDDAVLPILEGSGLKLDKDFLLAYSPERVDPGNSSFHTMNIPRVVGGVTPLSTRAAELIYSRIVPKIFTVSSARTAEMAKLLENTFRWVNIALVNELTFVARAIGVDIYEVIDAAATKPFGFMPFYPGPGVGGHCIPLDPFYLQWVAKVTGEGTRFVELAESVNSSMPRVVVDRVTEALNDRSRSVRGSNILVLGVAYKPDVSDQRESPAAACILRLQKLGARVTYSDPHAPTYREHGVDLASVELSEEAIRGADCVLVLTDHSAFDYDMVLATADLIVDTRNAFGRRGLRDDKISTL